MFESGVIVPRTAALSLVTEQYLLANVVSMTAAVAPNTDNTLAAQLKQRGQELDQKEREIDARAQDAAVISTSWLTYILSVVLVGQTVLILLNYFFDYRRAKRRVMQSQTVSS
jgi:hypothetical protein